MALHLSNINEFKKQLKMNLYRLVFSVILLTNFWLMAQNNYINHKVEKGETLTQISNQYDVSSQEILKLNPDAATGLKEGAYLIIPKLAPLKKEVISKQIEVGETIHTVAEKETLYGLSKKYKISVDDLIKANPFLNEGLKVGQTLNISQLKDSNSKNVEKEVQSNKNVAVQSEDVSDFHIVKAGETKFSLAKKYGLTLEELENLNPEIKSGLPVDYKLIVKKNKNQIKSTKSVDKNAIKTELVAEKKESSKTEKLELGKNQIIAKKGMTIFGIATDNNVTVEELMIANPNLKDGLKENDIINIPNKSKEISKTNVKSEKLTSTAAKRIAILIPFNNIEKSKIEVQLTKDKFLNMVSDFYLGTKVAIDSAKSKKMKHYVEYFDSNETANSSTVDELVSSGKLNNFDVVIGCFYPNNNDNLVKLLSDKPVVVVSPLRFQDTSYASLIETMVKKEELFDEMISFFNKSENHLISIIDTKKTASVSYFNNQTQTVNFKFEDKDNFKTEELLTTLQKEKTNVIFFDSESMKFLTKINQLVASLKIEGYKIRIVSLDYNSSIEADEVFADFQKNQLIYFSTFDNSDTNQTKLFDKNYRSKYKGMPNQFVYRGYDVALDVFDRASRESTFINTFSKASQQLNTKFNYVQTNEKGYKNKGFYLLQLNENSTITVLN